MSNERTSEAYPNNMKRIVKTKTKTKKSTSDLLYFITVTEISNKNNTDSMACSLFSQLLGTAHFIQNTGKKWEAVPCQILFSKSFAATV